MAILSERLRLRVLVQLGCCYTVLDHVRQKTLDSFNFSDTSASFWELLGI